MRSEATSFNILSILVALIGKFTYLSLTCSIEKGMAS